MKRAFAWRRGWWVIALATVMPGAALAHNYTYLEGGYLNRDLGGSRSESGFRLGGSASVAPPLALFGEFSDTGDIRQLTLGGLFHTPLNRVVDLNLGASLEDVRVRNRTDTGLGLRAGLRWQLDPQRFELHPELRYVDVFDDSLTSLRVAMLVRLNPQLDLQGAIQGGDEDRYEIGLRYNFGPWRTGR